MFYLLIGAWQLDIFRALDKVTVKMTQKHDKNLSLALYQYITKNCHSKSYMYLHLAIMLLNLVLTVKLWSTQEAEAVELSILGILAII